MDANELINAAWHEYWMRRQGRMPYGSISNWGRLFFADAVGPFIELHRSHMGELPSVDQVLAFLTVRAEASALRHERARRSS